MRAYLLTSGRLFRLPSQSQITKAQGCETVNHITVSAVAWERPSVEEISLNVENLSQFCAETQTFSRIICALFLPSVPITGTEPVQDQMPANIDGLHSGSEESTGRRTGPSYADYRYGEEEIISVARALRQDGKQRWSENPRLYIVFRDISRRYEIDGEEFMDKFLDKYINDMWLPIPESDSILEYLLPKPIRHQFCLTQYSVCSRPSDFQLGFRRAHGHFKAQDQPFRSREIIGRGSYGVVDEILSRTGEVYARKTFRRSSDHSRAAITIQSFRRELQALNRIQHRHCVQIVGSYTKPRRLAIIMSPRADYDLEEFLRRAETSLDAALSSRLRGWFGCLATAVEYLHANNFRHRDIKPANILIHGKKVLLVDFGLVHDWKDLSGSTTSGETRGTLRYAAPEVVLQNRANSSSDIWSLGCVFLEMATVLKGKHIHQLRDHFKSQADNANFYNNECGIRQWISAMEDLSDVGNAPFFWIAKMLQRHRDSRPKAAEVIELIRNSDCAGSQSNQYFDSCCRKVEQAVIPRIAVCSRCDMPVGKNTSSARSQCVCTSQTRIYWNPELVRTSLPVQHVRSLFHPNFMVRHLTTDSLNEFTRRVVTEGSWDSVRVNVRLTCLPGRPLHLSVRKFVPSCNLLSYGKELGASMLDPRDSLPVGIHRANPKLIAINFDKYLDNIVDNHLMEHSGFFVRLCEQNYSSRVIDCLFDWYDVWKREIRDDQLAVMKNAIKFIAIHKIIGQLPKLEGIPEDLQRGKHKGRSGPQQECSDEQSSRLVTRQVKVGLFLLQTSLLENLLNNLRILLGQPDSWTTCLFVSMCLAFVLERLEVESREFLEEAQKLYKEDAGQLSDIQEYCLGVDRFVFQRIYRLLSARVRRRSSNGSPLANELSETLINLRLHFQLVEGRRIERDVQELHSSRFVSALLDLL